MAKATGANATGGAGRYRSTPRLASGLDPTSLQLTPAEAFLLSRVDGLTPSDVLRQMGAMSPAEVDVCLEKWTQEGVVCIDGPESKEAAPSPASGPFDLDLDVDESCIDAALDLPEATQRRILAFEQGLERPYHALLSVPADADVRAIKRAYFALSKEFHPDRYFRREIGDYGARLDRIFKRVLEAYELLSDPATRKEVQSAQAATQPASAPQPQPPPVAQVPPVARAPKTPSAVPLSRPRAGANRSPRPAGPRMQPLSKLERLKKRMPRRRVVHEIDPERLQQANQFYEAALHSKRMGRMLEAAASIRLAIAFDATQARFKEAFGEIQAGVAEEKVTALFERDSSQIEAAERKEALRLCEEVLLYRPHDPEVNCRAAMLALDLDQIDDALESANRAVEHSPEVARYHRVLGQVYQQKRDKGHALHHLKQAVDLDPQDAEARRLLALYKQPGARTR